MVNSMFLLLSWCHFPGVCPHFFASGLPLSGSAWDYCWCTGCWGAPSPFMCCCLHSPFSVVWPVSLRKWGVCHGYGSVMCRPPFSLSSVYISRGLAHHGCHPAIGWFPHLSWLCCHTSAMSSRPDSAIVGGAAAPLLECLPSPWFMLFPFRKWTSHVTVVLATKHLHPGGLRIILPVYQIALSVVCTRKARHTIKICVREGWAIKMCVREGTMKLTSIVKRKRNKAIVHVSTSCS